MIEMAQEEKTELENRIRFSVKMLKEKDCVLKDKVNLME